MSHEWGQIVLNPTPNTPSAATTFWLASTVRRITPKGFPDALVPTGDLIDSNYSRHQRQGLRAPIGMGLRTRRYPFRSAFAPVEGDRVWDIYNLLTMFDDIRMGPLKDTPTLTSGPATYKVIEGSATLVNGDFFEASDTLFMYGSGAAAANEPIWFYTGPTDTWASSGLNAAIGGNLVNRIAGMIQMPISGTTNYFALSPNGVTTGGNLQFIFKSTSKSGSWAVYAAAAETLPAGYTKLFRLLTYTGLLLSLGWGKGALSVLILDPTTGNWTSQVRGGVVVNQTDIGTPRGFLEFGGPNASNDIFFSTNNAMYWSPGTGSIGCTKLFDFRYPQGKFTGQLAKGLDGNLWFTDGPNIGRFSWRDGSGARDIRILGPFEAHDIGTTPTNRGTAEVEWDGLVAGKQGDVTCIVGSRTQRWLYVGVGGQAAATAGWLGIFDMDRLQWHSPYQNYTTNNLQLMGLMESAQDDGTFRLHFSEETAAGGNQRPQNFVQLCYNPNQLAAGTYKYNNFAAGNFLTSWDHMGLPYFKKGMFSVQFQVLALLSSGQSYLLVANAEDGGALGTAQTVDSTTVPPEVWMDKTDTTPGVGVQAQQQQVQVQIVCGSDNTKTPIIQSMLQTYTFKPVRSNGKAFRSLEFWISLLPEDYGQLDNEDIQALWNLIDILQQTQPLASLQLGPDTFYGHLTVYEAEVVGKPLVASTNQLDFPGKVKVTFEEIIR